MTPSGPQVSDPPRPCRRGRATTRRSSPRGHRSAVVTGAPAAPASRWRARRLVAPTPSAPPGRPPRRPPGRAHPPPRKPPWPLPVRRPRPVPPVTGVDAVARRRTRTGLDVVSGPSVVTAADDTSPLFRKSWR